MRVARRLSCLLALVVVGCLKSSGARVSDETAPAPPGARTAGTPADPPGDMMIFLLIGQSNMVGAPKPEASDQVEDARVMVLAYEDCPRLGRAYNHWYPAQAPLHGCDGGVGPGDAFAKVLADAYPGKTIGLVPLAINGVDIDMFAKGVVSKRRGEFRIPPDDHWPGAYPWVIERATLAQRSGSILGIAFHQGESDTGQAGWVGKVKTLVTDLRADLRLGDAPFVAGELLHTGCCGKWHNSLVSQLPNAIGKTRVVSASDLAGVDSAHFDLAGQRELGRRYGAAMLELLQDVAAPAEVKPPATLSTVAPQ